MRYDLLLERVADANDSTNIESLVEFLRLDVAWYIDTNYTAGLETALDTGARAKLSIECWLSGWSSGRRNVEGVAACCGSADAAEARDLPGPRRTAGESGC